MSMKKVKNNNRFTQEVKKIGKLATAQSRRENGVYCAIDRQDMHCSDYIYILW